MVDKMEAGSGYTGKQIQILEVAERLFAERGFDGASVRDIAHEAGVNVAMISYYFGSKEKLLQAVFNYRIGASRLTLEYLINDANKHPFEKVDVIVEGMVDRILENRTFHKVMLQCQITTDNQAITNFISESKLRNLELINKIIAEGQEKGVFVKDIDAAMLMMTVSGTIYQAAAGSAYFRIAHPKEVTTDEGYTSFLKSKLKTHLKRVIKATLTYEGN